MAADEDAGPRGVKLSADRGVVTPGIAADVGHHHRDLLHVEAQRPRIHLPHGIAVDVAVHCPEWADGREPHRHVGRPDVARMPYLITLGEILRILLVPPAVGV